MQIPYSHTFRTPSKTRCCISRGYPPNNTFQILPEMSWVRLGERYLLAGQQEVLIGAGASEARVAIPLHQLEYVLLLTQRNVHGVAGCVCVCVCVCVGGIERQL